ncbi:MAG: nuclear transport factor 2 family protein [Oceanicaulis sp.]
MQRIATAALGAVLFTAAASADDHDPKAVIEGVYAAFAAGEPDTFAAALHPDIVWNEAENLSYADGNPYEGPQAVMEGVIGRVMADWSSFAATPEDMIAEGDRVVVLGRYTGVHAATGKPMDAQMVHVWTVRDGQAVSFQQYVDTLQWFRAEQPG